MLVELLRFGASLLAVAALIGLVAWMKLGRDVPQLSRQEAREIADHAMPGFGNAAAPVLIVEDMALVAGDDGRIALVRAFGARHRAHLVTGALSIPGDGACYEVGLADSAEPMVLHLGEDARAWADRLERL